jgi:hypothetical protein
MKAVETLAKRRHLYSKAALADVDHASPVIGSRLTDTFADFLAEGISGCTEAQRGLTCVIASTLVVPLFETGDKVALAVLKEHGHLPAR